jgi:hypothetical protein
MPDTLTLTLTLGNRATLRDLLTVDSGHWLSLSYLDLTCLAGRMALIQPPLTTLEMSLRSHQKHCSP